MPIRDGKIIYMQRCMQHEYVIFLCATITSSVNSSFFPFHLSIYMFVYAVLSDSYSFQRRMLSYSLV